MAVLGTTDISTTKVRNTLGEDNNDVGRLCRSDKINMWSRRKPVDAGRITIPIDDVGKADNGTFGFVIPTYNGEDNQVWTYQKPSSYKRLGDFRGYYHNAPIPISVTTQPDKVRSKFTIMVMMSPRDWYGLSIYDTFIDTTVYFGAEIYNQNGVLVNWASGAEMIEIDLPLNITKISTKFFLTDTLKLWEADDLPNNRRWSLPRQFTTDNKFWNNVTIDNTPIQGNNYFTLQLVRATIYKVRVGNVASNANNGYIRLIPQGGGQDTQIHIVDVILNTGDNEFNEILPVKSGTIYDAQLFYNSSSQVQRSTVLIVPPGIDLEE